MRRIQDILTPYLSLKLPEKFSSYSHAHRIRQGCLYDDAAGGLAKNILSVRNGKYSLFFISRPRRNARVSTSYLNYLLPV